jgi:hypothetical protein
VAAAGYDSVGLARSLLIAPLSSSFIVLGLISAGRVVHCMLPQMWALGTLLQMLSQSIMSWWLSVPALWTQRHSPLCWVLNHCQSSSILTWFSLSM